MRSQDVTLHEFPSAGVSEEAVRSHPRAQKRNPRLNEITVNLTLCKSAVSYLVSFAYECQRDGILTAPRTTLR